MNVRKKLFLLFSANIISSVGSGITSFAVPWLIINMDNGEQLYGYLFLGVTIFVFFLTPYLGVLIDRYSRKNILLLCESIGALTFASVLGFYFTTGEISFPMLIILTIVSSLYIAVQIPALLAFTQEIFEQKDYNKVNSAMEVQSQSATFISAGLVALLIGKIDIWIIFVLDIGSFMIAFFILLFVPYKHSFKKESTAMKQDRQFIKDIMLTLSFMKKNVALMLFLLCTLVPSIMVLVGNYVNPVFVYKDLGSKPDVQGYSSVIYAISAMLGGVVASFLSTKFGNYVSVFITYTIYLIGIIGIFAFPFLAPFLILRTFAGIGNAGSRVLRKNIMMDLIPNHIIGRVNSFMTSLSLLAQSLLVGFFSLSIGKTGARMSFVFMSVIMVVALFIMFLSRMKMSTPKKQDGLPTSKNEHIKSI